MASPSMMFASPNKPLVTTASCSGAYEGITDGGGDGMQQKIMHLKAITQTAVKGTHKSR